MKEYIMTAKPDFETDVLVVGSGPMGAATTLALASYGIRVHTVTRWNWLANSPRAHITDPRTVEILRDLGVEQEAARSAIPWDQMGDMVFAESLTGREFARAKLVGRGDDRISDYLASSPCGYLDIPQNYLEPILVSNAAARGASFSFNTDYLDHVQDDEGVTAQVEDRLSGRKYHIRAKYMVGADGARSRILEQLDLPLEGQLARAATAYVLFNADLSSHIAHRPGIIHFLVTESASYGELGMGMLRCVRAWSEWIAGWGFDKDKEEPDFSPEAILSRIRGYVGDPELEIDVKATSVWYVNEAWAPQYSKGRVFLGGDAVHRHPPSSSRGSNTSIQDGYNIAWKLAYVLKGIASPSLLETYSHERAPIGKYIVKRANKSRRDYAELTKVFKGEDPAAPVASGLARLRDTGPAGAIARDALRKAIDYKQDEFNSHGTDTNQRYASSAIVPDSSVEEEETWRRDNEIYAQPTTRPGAKLPHAWLVDKRGLRISTLDLIGKGLFTVVTGLSGQAWVSAAKRLGQDYVRLLVVGATGSADPYTSWPRISEIEEAGALLVRPDGFVAWRMPLAVWGEDEAFNLLSNAMSAILGKKVDADFTSSAEFVDGNYAAT